MRRLMTSDRALLTISSSCIAVVAGLLWAVGLHTLADRQEHARDRRPR